MARQKTAAMVGQLHIPSSVDFFERSAKSTLDHLAHAKNGRGELHSNCKRLITLKKDPARVSPSLSSPAEIPPSYPAEAPPCSKVSLSCAASSSRPP